MEIAEPRFRRELRDEVVARLAESRNVLAVGPNGSGRTSLLRSVAEQVQQSAPVVRVDAAAEATRERVRAARPDAAIMLDGLEHADPQLLGALGRHVEAGGSLVSAIDAGSRDSLFLRAAEDGGALPSDAHRFIMSAERLSLDPLADEDIRLLIQARSEAPIDSDTAHTICALAEGRPRWALDLLTIAHEGGLRSCPAPAISHVQFGALHLPAVHSLVRSIGPLPAEIASAAVALSDLGPRDLTAITEMIGAEAADRLLHAGVLIRPADRELYHVPPFVALALRPQSLPQLLADAQDVVVRQLLGLEALGIPMTDAEAALCARALAAQPSASAPPLTAVEASVLHRVVAHLVNFDGATEARTLLLRAGSIETPNDRLHRAKCLGVLAGPAAGLAEIERLSCAEGSPESIAAQFLGAQFDAEMNVPTAPGTPLPGPRCDAGITSIVRAWNALGPIPEDVARMRRIASRTRATEVADLAIALEMLDAVFDGRLPESTWLSRGDALPVPPAGPHAFALLREATLLARALTVLVSGELALRSEELWAAADALAPREYHRRWLRHLHAAGTALACGDAVRAGLEWKALRARMPRRIPVRLRDYVDRIAHAIDSAGDLTPDRAAELPLEPQRLHRFIAYLTGRHAVSLRTHDLPKLEPNALPVIRLARAHLSASEERNPAEMLKISSKLQRLELWAPAAFALTEARMIFLGRRASGSVRQCDLRLDELHSELRARVPWYRPDDLPSTDRVRLTPRERSVAQLAAAGMSNREICERLGCSVRTVESHLAQARAKLGVSRRDDLAARLVETS